MRKISVGQAAGRLLSAALILFFACVSARSKALEYQTGTTPAWVHPVKAASTSRRQGSGYGGTEMLLSDSQTRIEAHGVTAYGHYASKALDSHGVQDIAAISLSFDPTFQSLTLISIDVIRDGRRLAKMGSATIRVLHRETELEYQLFDGNKTISVAIDDVRVGDIVEYAYSLSGLNPVFANRVAGGAQLQWGVPVDRVFARLLVPQGRQVKLSLRNTKEQAKLAEADGYRDYRWERDSVAALRVEKDAPAGYDPYASVHWSEFADWEAVVAWAMPLYRIPADPGADVTREVERIRKASPDPAQRILDVLHLVQRDIRYLGVEVGPGSHAPTAPALVYKRRFGDCKDKAMLTVTMLRALGIEARPALVQTDRSIRPGLEATPNAFNHVLVRAALGGKTYWIDPTRAPQKGDLAHLYQADYGQALVLDKDTRALVSMAPPASPRTSIRTVFDSSKGFDTPVSYTITTTVHGGAAESMRADIASRGLADKEMDYLNFYARAYPGIKVAVPLAVSDDETNNTISLTESYAIANFWPHAANQKRRNAIIDAAEIDSHFAAPKAVNRIAPLRISFPEEIEEITEVKLPRPWNITEDVSTVRDAAFVFEHRVRKGEDGRSVVLTNTYKAHADRVNPEAMTAYAANLRKADDAIGFSLHWTDPAFEAAAAAKAATAPKTADTANGKDHGSLAGLIGVPIVCAWVLLALQWLAAPLAHKSTDRKILLIFTAFSLALVAVLTWADGIGTLMFSLFAFAQSTSFLPKIAASAPASHWIATSNAHEGPAKERLPFSSMLVILGGLSWLLGLLLFLYYLWTAYM